MNMKSDRDVCESLASIASGEGGRPKQPALSSYPVPGRSAEYNCRIASHEAGHAYVGRCMGTALHSVSIIRGDGFEGRCLSKGYQAGFYEKPEDETVEIVDLCERAQRLTPELGTDRISSAEFFQQATTICVELVAGTVAETILHPHEPPLPASHDEIEASAFGALAVASPRSVDAFLQYCRAEAAALIKDHLGAVKAIADALIERGELSGGEVDEIIAVALAREAMAAEKVRQIKWRAVEASAALLRGESDGDAVGVIAAMRLRSPRLYVR